MRQMVINNQKIGDMSKPYIIAEISGNHCGDIARAKNLIHQASNAGVDAVKIQTYTPDTMTINCDLPDFTISAGPWKDNTLYELYEKAHTPFEWHEELFAYARDVGVTLFSSPFDETAVDLLEALNTPAYKVASFELVDLPLIKYIAQKKKPMILSTGMATQQEIHDAVRVAKENGCEELAILHCVSGYPTPVEESNLRTIQLLQEEFDVIVGLSCHTLSTLTAVVGVSLGACIIEKHITLSREEEGPDVDFSLEPHEFASLVRDVDLAYKSLGRAGYSLKESEKGSGIFRRSIYAVESIAKGEPFTEKNTRRIRPGHGLAPKFYQEVLGKKALCDISRGTPLREELVEFDEV